MGKLEKQIERLMSKPKDYTFSEAHTLLIAMGYELSTKGKTSGSRVKYYRPSDERLILLHKPHPGDEMRVAATKELLSRLIEYGDIK